jgi:hypothetical protein
MRRLLPLRRCHNRRARCRLGQRHQWQAKGEPARIRSRRLNSLNKQSNPSLAARHKWHPRLCRPLLTSERHGRQESPQNSGQNKDTSAEAKGILVLGRCNVRSERQCLSRKWQAWLKFE